MRKIISTTWVSIDGYISGPNNDMSFVGEFFDESMGKYESDIVKTADTLILGRLTYESFAGSWPHVPEDPSVSEVEKDYARRLNAMQKIVFSKTIENPEWNNTRVMIDIDPGVINQIKSEKGKDMLIYGSASIVQAFTNMKLIDEYHLLVHPVILGGGKLLFKGIKNKHKLALVGQKKLPSGVMLLRYKPEATH